MSCNFVRFEISRLYSFLCKLKSHFLFYDRLNWKQSLEYKEALIFGLLGVLKLRNEINVLSSVTGAKRDHSTGIIYS